MYQHRVSTLIQTTRIKDRVIPLELDPSQNFLRNICFIEMVTVCSFGTRFQLDTQYSSNIYEELRKVMATKGIKLNGNVTYDKDDKVYVIFR
ncbi:hypothetical protein RclHR1_03970012 [Rhizophagus clarus]|uniref:Uncharacterized protein n=1 Tax=Rhizophagus clarus TaxID=94130 RepID=A0A2Z6RUS2_9GLOM|nr:hypothetical protein RclHR1_03970012 [Rhizophagus clarus]GES98835.1 hypothetical protein GLOIN_2v1478604 [Rhizophagus clarus]